MSNLTSSLTISLIDNVSKPARTVAQALKDAENKVKEVSKAMAGTGATDRFTASLSKLKASAKDIQTVAVAWKDYARASNLAADSTKWTRQQANDVKAWERQQISALREVTREQRAFYRAQAAAQKQAEAQRNRPGVVSHVARHFVGPAGVMAAGAGGARAVHGIIHEAADAEQLRFRIRELSRDNRSEAPFADDLAAQIAAKYPSITTGKALDNYIELRGNSLGHDGRVDPTIARRNAFAAARAQNAATALGFDMTPVDMQNLLKGVEGSGRAEDPKAVEKITDAYIRMKQVFGSAIASSMVRDYVANAKSANFSIGDDQFYLSNMVRMSEGNASRLGNEVNQTMSTLAGGSMKRAAGDWLVERGLADAKDMVKTGGGNVKFKNGIKDSATLETDQSAWAKGTLRNALERRGVFSEDKVEARMKLLRQQELKRNPNAEIDERYLRARAEHGLIAGDLAKAGFRTTVSDNLAHFIGNELLIERDTKAAQRASGLEAGDRLAENPVAAFKELTASIGNFATVLGSPAMKDVGGVLDAVAQSISSFSKTISDLQKENPELAKITSAGAIAGGAAGSLLLLKGGLEGLTSGFGLKGSAVALDASAEALSAAAARLGVSGGVPGGPAAPLTAAAAASSWPLLATLGVFGAGFGLIGYSGAKEGVTSGMAPATPDGAMPGFGPPAVKPWMPPAGKPLTLGLPPPTPENMASGAQANIDLKKFDDAKAAAKETGDQMQQSLNVTLTPNVDVSSISAANAAAEKLISTLARASSMAASVQASAKGAASAPRANIPALGPTGRGNFGMGNPGGSY